MFQNLDLIDTIIVLLICSPLFFFILSGPLDDWLRAREKRKKAAAAAADGVESAESASSGASAAAKPA